MDFGLGDAVAKFVTKYRIENNLQKINQILGLTSKIYLFLDLCIFVVLVVIYFFIENIFVELSSLEIERFRSVYIIAGLFSLLSFPFLSLNGLIIAHERFVFLKLCDLLNKVFTILLMAVSLHLGYKLYALIFINALVGIGIIWAKLIYLRKTTAIKIDFRFKSKDLAKQIFGFSAWVTVIGIAQRLLINITPTLLAIYSGTAAIAIFSIGSVMEGYVWTFAGALNGMFLPKITTMNNGVVDRKKITELMVRVGRIQLLVVGLLVVGIIVFGKEFIRLWMGRDFEKSYFVVLLLILPGLIPLTQNIASTLMYVENKLKYTACVYILSSCVSLLVSVLLIPQFEAIGAAIGISAGLTLFQVIAMNIVYYKVIKIDVVYFFKMCFLKMLPSFGAIVIIGLLINHYIKASHFLIFFLKIFVLGILYILIMWLFGLNKEEKNIFLMMFPRKR